MKKITTLLASLALSTTFTIAQDTAPATTEPVKPGASTPAKPEGGDKPKRDPEAMFKRIDSNSDGGITLEEFKASPAGKRNPDKVDEVFARRDKDGDKKITLEEFKAQGGGKKNKQ